MDLSYSQKTPMNVESGKSIHIKPRTMDISKEDLKLIVENIVDFKSFNLNGYSLWNFFKELKWELTIDMLNGPTYPHLVRNLWVRVEVYNEFASFIEENQKV